LGTGILLTVDLNGKHLKLQFDPSQSYAGEYFTVEATVRAKL